MSAISLSYWESDVYWRQNNKHFAELAPQNGGKQLIWRNYVTVTLCITGPMSVLSPNNTVRAQKQTQHQQPAGIILSSSTTGLLRERQCSLYISSPMPVRMKTTSEDNCNRFCYDNLPILSSTNKIKTLTETNTNMENHRRDVILSLSARSMPALWH